MTSDLWCAENVSMVRVFEDVVVLDLAADRYECLVDAAAGIDPRPDGRLEVDDAGLADALVWVFGVRTWPFAAHCWIQIGDLVVGDVLDRVRGYTPIRAV